mgnify:CR=1 FL=1
MFSDCLKGLNSNTHDRFLKLFQYGHVQTRGCSGIKSFLVSDTTNEKHVIWEIKDHKTLDRIFGLEDTDGVIHFMHYDKLGAHDKENSTWFSKLIDQWTTYQLGLSRQEARVALTSISI